ncbi:patatin-like phospholipase family protein [Salimicrobium halophilum]|uniref:NTE family protein n=1 Tax=Salimicrobium halophilum TaxID=86666 RepID=A0A1G8PTV3_9BACI|nr:patatin-like phospholipase family protein [Salimicrobium halophilum]SDI95927.1 NTE family protein [Salimicrobium halophilum]
MKKIDGVFSGGGVKAIAFAGALETLEQQGYSFQRTAGTSAGAIFASLLAADYKAGDMEKLMTNLTLETITTSKHKRKPLLPFTRWMRLYFQLGLYKGEEIEEQMEKLLARKGIYTFGDLAPGRLKIVCSDISLGRMVVLPDDLERIYGIEAKTFSVAKAVRMSAGIPFFFTPVRLEGKQGKSLIVDGGVLSNFPLWIWEKPYGNKKRPVLGLQLADPPNQLPPQRIENGIEMFQALFRTMKKAHDARYISHSKSKNIMFLPVNEFETTDFQISTAEKEELVKLGKEKAKEFLEGWRQ